jgi:galactokinase
MSIQDLVVQHYEKIFGAKPAHIVRAPGRVNLIGEHTDYNEGFVMPMAIDRAVWIALRARSDRQVIIHSLDFDDPIIFDLDHMTREENSPAEYVKGVAWALAQKGYATGGFEGVMKGDVPIGAGLSSSAALELAIARTMATVAPFAWDAPKMALVSQFAENEWVGVKCGIMDQMISAVGQANHAVLIDCRDLSTQTLPLPPQSVVVILDTNTRRGLVDSAYNERREQCEAAARFFGVKFLRDVTLAQFNTQSGGLDPLVAQRAKHVISENERVLDAKQAMLQGDALALGKLMVASHVSLRDDFEVSSPALNRVVECALEHEACFGARMTGAGFGGCGVALVDARRVDAFLEHVERWYNNRISEGAIKPTVYVCQATDGAGVISH